MGFGAAVDDQDSSKTQKALPKVSKLKQLKEDLFMNCADYPFQVDRIVGGENATIGEFPWQAALAFKSGGTFCGGTLILEKFVITAAHCIQFKSPESVLIVLGDHDLYQTDPGEVTHEVKKWIIHHSYNRSSADYDIAIIELKEPVKINKFIDTACLPMIEPNDEKTVLISGWGSTRQKNVSISRNKQDSSILQKAAVNIVERKKCQEKYDVPNNIYGQTGEITDRMICAASEGKDACQGDSGGMKLLNRLKVIYMYTI